MIVRRPSLVSLRRAALAALAAGLIGAPAPALAIDERPPSWWARLDQLVAAQAYPAAEAELNRALAESAFRAAYADRAAYHLGFVQRRTGRAVQALSTLAGVPRDSRYFPQALAEIAAIRRDRGEDAEAIARYDELLALVPEPERAGVRAPLADLYFQTGQYAKAMALYQALAGELGPHRERASFAWGWSLLRAEQEDAAINVWRQALERFTTSPYAHAVRLALGNVLLARGEHLQASTYYNEAARHGRDEALIARAELLAGEAYADRKEYGLAISHYRAVADDSPLREPARYGEAWCMWQQGQAAEARERLLDWLKRYPQSSYRGAAFFALGAIERQLGYEDASASAWRKACEVAPRSTYAEESRYMLAKTAFDAGDIPGTIAEGRKLEASFPKSRYLGAVLWMRGEAYLQLAMYQEAVIAFTSLATLGPQEFLAGQGAQVDYKMGLAHFYGGNFGEAARVLEAVTEGPLVPTALFWQAEARYRLGQHDAARTLFGRLIARHRSFPRIAEAYYGLGWASFRLGDFSGAKNAFATAVSRLEPGRSQEDALYRLGLSQLNMHEWQAARASFSRLLGLSQSPALLADARFQTAWSHYREGALEEAATAFGQFAESHRASPLAPQALIWQGRALFRQDRFGDAASPLRAAIAHPLVTPGQLYEAREQLAAAYHNAGSHDEARQMYEQLLQTENLPAGRVDDVRQGLVQALIKGGKLREARRALTQRAPLGEAERAGLLAVAEGFVAKADWDEVIETYRALTPAPPQLQHWAGKAHLEKRAFAEAIRLLEPLRGVESHDLRPQVLFDLARAQAGAGDAKAARATFVGLAEAYMTRPIAAVALIEAAQAAQAARDVAGASDLYRQVGENRTFSLDRRRQAWMALGDMHKQQKQWGNALLAYRGARALGPNDSLGASLAGYWAGSVLVELKQFKEAVRELETLRFGADTEPLPSLAALKRGEALERLNRFRDALELYGKLAETAPATERAEAKTRADWILKHVPKEMRR